MVNPVPIPGLTLRAATSADAEFLFQVYASTRLEELAVTGWSAEQIQAFLRSQFAMQDKQYRLHYPDARFEVVILDDPSTEATMDPLLDKPGGLPVGRIYVDSDAQALHLLDIALLPAFRRRGLGTALLKAVQAEAAASGRSVGLYVERNNPALGLYRALGFELVDPDHAVYLHLHWHAPRPPAAPVRGDALSVPA